MTAPHRQDDGLLREARDYIRDNIKEMGPCDHSVNVCVCGDIALADRIDAFLSATPASRDGAEGTGENLYMPTYGKLPWDQLGRDVMEAITGQRLPFKFTAEGYPGHEMAGINFNSLARIVDKYRLAAPPKPAPDALRDVLETIKRTTFSGSEMGDEYIRGNRDAHATCAAMAKRALAPLPAVAAEAVAWRCTNSEGQSVFVEREPVNTHGVRVTPLYASPPLIRGEREAIAQTNLIRDAIQRVYDEMCVQFSGVHSDDKTDGWLLNLHYSLKLLQSSPAALSPTSGDGGGDD